MSAPPARSKKKNQFMVFSVKMAFVVFSLNKLEKTTTKLPPFLDF